MKSIIEKIQQKNCFSEVSIEEFAPDEKWAFQIAKNLGNKMKVTQLRKIFNALKQIDNESKNLDSEADFNNPKIYMLIPHLAYAEARKLINKDFYMLIKKIIGDGESTMIKKVKDFNRFIEFMTAIVAYHKQFQKS